MKKLFLIYLFITDDAEKKGLYEVGGKAFIMKTLIPVKTFYFKGMTAPEAYRKVHALFTRWKHFGAVNIYLQDGLEVLFDKERAAANSNSGRPRE